MQIIKKKISDLVFDPNNSRKHSKKNIDAIKGSLTKFGQQKPIVINSKSIVIAGNGTVQAAKELKWQEIDAVITNLEGFNETAFAIADNRTGELAEWDDDILGKTLQALQEVDFDLSSIGFDPSDIPELKSDHELSEKDDEIPEIEKNKHGVVQGDIWILGNHRIMCGDSASVKEVEKLMDGQKADMVLAWN